MVSGKKTKTVAGTFYQLLVLKTLNYIDVKQPAPFGDISITPTVRRMQKFRFRADLRFSSRLTSVRLSLLRQ